MDHLRKQKTGQHSMLTGMCFEYPHLRFQFACVNRFVDWDMLLCYMGGAIGHLQPVSTTFDLPPMETSIDNDDGELFDEPADNADELDFNSPLGYDVKLEQEHLDNDNGDNDNDVRTLLFTCPVSGFRKK